MSHALKPINDEPSNPSRRIFFRRFFAQTTQRLSVVREELRGRPQMRLGELHRFPDHVLRNITPEFCLDMEYRLNEGSFHIKNQQTGDFLEVLRLNEGEEEILKYFGWDLSLEQIARQIETQGTGGVSTYPQVKALFLRLTRCGICHPAQSLADLE